MNGKLRGMNEDIGARLAWASLGYICVIGFIGFVLLMGDGLIKLLVMPWPF